MAKHATPLLDQLESGPWWLYGMPAPDHIWMYDIQREDSEMHSCSIC